MGNVNGMVLHLYKHLDGSMFDTNKLSYTPKDKERTFIAFGNFDRLCFSPVEKFVDYLSEASSAYRWIGGRKDIMLYPLEADIAQRHFVFGEKEKGYVQPQLFIKQNGEICRRKFLLVSMLYVSGRAKASVKPYNIFLDCCKNAILKVVEEANLALKKCEKESVICEVFGTFNSSEIAILWGADQFTDVQYIVDQLRYMYFEFDATGKEEPVFISTYTIVALTGAEFCSQDIQGGAMIQLAASTLHGVDEVREYDAPLTYLLDLCKSVGQEKTKVDFCAGEYDYIIESLPPQLELLTKGTSGGVSGSLHIKNSEFKKFFSHSTTRLFYREEDIDEQLKNVNWKKFTRVSIPSVADHSSDLQKNWESIREIAGTQEDEISVLYNEFRANVLGKVQSTSSLGCTLDLLFSDYVQCMNITPDRQWANDLKVQFSAALTVLNSLFHSELNAEGYITEWYIDRVRDVVALLQQQISHVSDAGKLFFEEPCSHSESTSQYDLLFHMYYGAVKQILSVAYESREGKHYSMQSRLIPLIRFEPVPRIESKLFMDMNVLRERLVDIALPYDAWCEPAQYIPLLVHELYHYVAPVDRRERNEMFAKILLVELNTGALQDMIAYTYEQSLSNNSEPLCKIDEVEFNSAIARVVHKIRRLCTSFVKKRNITELIGAKADTQWTEFEEAFYRWCGDGSEGYITAESEYGILLTELCDYICNSLKKDLADTKVSPYDKAIIDELTEKLSNCSTDDAEEPVLTDHIDKVRQEWLPNIVKQLREILPDLGMVQLSGMSVTEYLLIFAVFQDKLQNIPSELHIIDIELALRIGVIIDKLLVPVRKTDFEKLEALDELKDDFCDKYIAYVKCCSWAKYEEKDVVARAGKWFSFFKTKYDDYLNNYAIFNDWLQNLVTKQFMPVCNAGRSYVAESLNDYFTTLADAKEPGDLFNSNLSLVHKFQVQPFFEELKAPDEEYSAGNSLNYPLPRQPKQNGSAMQKNLSISAVFHLNGPILRATQQLTDTHKTVFGTEETNCRFWYRGSQNANFDILPSVMVHFLDDQQMSLHSRKGENAIGTLWEYQRSILERFKYQADGAPEFINSASYTTSDYMALMQHYGQHTLYLDWSEDVYSSLYFALENEILQDPQNPPKYGGEDAALYILDPMLYNRARKMLVDRVWKQNEEQFCPDDSWFHKQGRSIQEMPDGHIPNVSIGYNKNRYGIFSLDVPENVDVNFARKKKYLEAKGDAKKATLLEFELEMWNLPLAVYTSRLNPRIRSQSGQFIAYSPFSIPVYAQDNKKERSADHFSYLSLLKIQEYFIECFPEEQQFMYVVKIKAHAKEAVARYLRDVGINRYRIYPELANIKL